MFRVSDGLIPNSEPHIHVRKISRILHDKPENKEWSSLQLCSGGVGAHEGMRSPGSVLGFHLRQAIRASIS